MEKEKKRFKLAKSSRLLKSHEFARIKNYGKSFSNQYFIVAFLRNGGIGPRLGITIPKYIGKAVIRNQLKRIIREIFRLKRDLLPYGVDLNIICKKQASKLKPNEIKESIEKIFLKIRIL